MTTKQNHALTIAQEVEIIQNDVSANTAKNISKNTATEANVLLNHMERATKKMLWRAVSNILQNPEFSFSFFDKYKNTKNGGLNTEVLLNKFKKYYGMHENILAQALAEEYEKMPQKNPEDRDNFLKNFVSKYLYILFIFSEKIKISDLETAIRFSLPRLSDMYAHTSDRIRALEDFGVQETKKLQDLYGKDIENFQKMYATEKGNAFSEEMFLSSMYRYLHKENSKNNSADIAQEIAEGFEKNYQTAFNKMYYIFATWAESGYQKTHEGLLNIEIVLRRLLDGMIFLKSKDIAFVDFPMSDIKDENFVEAFSEKFVGDNYFDSYGPVFERLIACTCLDDFSLKQKIYEEINEELQNIAKEKAESRMPIETRRYEKINEKRVLFDQWKTVLDEQKYEIVFSKVFSQNGIMNFPEFLKLDNDKYFDVFFEYYVIDQEIKEKDRASYRKSLRTQLDYIKTCKGQKLQEFIEADVNNLNFIVLWWRFVLKVRQAGNVPNVKKVSEIADAPYGITERISENLKDIIQEWKITFDPDGRIKNTSVKGTNAILMDLVKGLKKGFIDMSQEKIILTNKDTKKLGKIRDFYLPPGVANENLEPQEEIEKIRSYIDSGIDAFFMLLQKKDLTDSSQRAYFQNLVSAKVLPEWGLSDQDLEKIQYLVEILKFTKNRIKHIQEMLDIADRDTEILKKNAVINKILSHDAESGFGPRKKFSRAFEKLMAEYGGNFNEIGDFTRLRVMVEDNPDNMVRQVTDFVRAAAGMPEVTHATVTDKTGEPISMPMKASGYRDTKVLLKMRSGNTVEVQFQYRSMYEMKDKWLDLLSSEGARVFEKMRQEEKLFETEELADFLEYCQKQYIELPKQEILQKLMKDSNAEIAWEKYENLLTKTKISMDDTYHITRTLDEKSSVRVKFTRLERVLADVAQAKIVINYLKWRWVQL